MKPFHFAVLLLVLLAVSPASSQQRGLCADGSDTPRPTMTPTTTPAPTSTPAATTATPAPTPAPTVGPVDCKLYSENKDPAAFDGICVQDVLDQKWYQHKNLTAEVEASNGGKPCVPTTVTKLCEPVNCAYTDAFGECKVQDYGWNKAITRTIDVQPLYGGAACPAPPAKQLETCDAEHYCGPLDVTTSALCRAAFAKSSKMNVGFSFSGSWLYSGPIQSVWQCVKLCGDTADCIGYTARTNGDGAVTCATWRTTGQIGFEQGAVTATMR